jgi:hypothetical protein
MWLCDYVLMQISKQAFRIFMIGAKVNKSERMSVLV